MLLRSDVSQRALLGACLSVLFTFAPAVARADDDVPATDAPSTAASQRRTAIIVTGAALFATSYAASAFIGASSANVTDVDHGYYRWMLVPVAGPFVTAASGDLRRDERVTIPALGVAQVAGAAMAILGLTLSTARDPKEAAIAVSPTGPMGSAGMQVGGAF